MGRMIEAVIVAVILSGTVFLSSGDTLQKDVLDHGRINIRSETGEFKGYMKKDPVLDDRINVYDNNGQLKGWLEKDVLDPETCEFRDR